MNLFHGQQTIFHGVRLLSVLLGIALFSSSPLLLAEHVHARPDAHAPIGVMGDHVMNRAEIMIEYRYMSMAMDGNRDGTGRVSVPLPGYMVSPLSMDMQMHMLGIMYAPTDRLTLSVMTPVLSLSMDHRVNMNNTEFTAEASGLGDVSIGAIYQLQSGENSSLLLNFAISGPTGSIDKKGVTPSSAGQAVQLPYPMQPGSGSHALIPGLTWTRQYNNWSWGAQGLYTHYLETNDNGYRLGDRLNASGWLARKLDHSFSISARLNALNWGNIDGSDRNLPEQPVVPTQDPTLRAGTRVDALLGINYVAHGLNALRFAAEVGAPVYQNLDGPQLETDLVFTLGAQYTF